MDMKDLKLVEDYCRNDFYSSHIYQKKSSTHLGTWCSYQGYEVINEKQLKILYKYGYDHYEYIDYYLINLGYEYRDKVILKILSNK